MATLIYDFEGDTLGQHPAGWSHLYATDTYTEEVVDQGSSQRFETTASDTNRTVATNTDSTGLTDVLLSGVFYRSALETWTLYHLRHDGSAYGAENSYHLAIGNDAIYLTELTNGSSTTLGSDFGRTITHETYYNFKFECVGTTIRCKTWNIIDVEPNWTISVTDSDHSSGDVTVGNYFGTTYHDDITLTFPDVNVTPGAGAAVVAGYDAAVKASSGVNQSQLGTVGIAGYDPDVIAPSTLIPETGTLAVAGLEPVVFAGTDVSPSSAGGLTITSFNPTVEGTPINVYPGLGTIDITHVFDVGSGNTSSNPTVLAVTNVKPTPLGTVAITGYNPAVTLPNIADPVGSLTITGFSPTVTATASAVHLYIKFKDSAGNVWTREIDRKPPVVAVTTTYIASTTDEVILADATAGAFNITLPTVTGRNGFTYEIKKTDSSANAVTIVGTIDGDANFDLEVQDESVTLKASDAAWWII